MAKKLTKREVSRIIRTTTNLMATGVFTLSGDVTNPRIHLMQDQFVEAALAVNALVTIEQHGHGSLGGPYWSGEFSYGGARFSGVIRDADLNRLNGNCRTKPA